MAEALTTLTRLLVVQEVQEDATGATVDFQQGCRGRLVGRDANHASHLRLDRRTQSRRHPVGVTFGEGNTITELIRGDNDVRAQLREDNGDRVFVLFQGHDGVFHLMADHPEFARLRAQFGEALGQKVRIWFIAHKPTLAFMDVLPAG